MLPGKAGTSPHVWLQEGRQMDIRPCTSILVHKEAVNSGISNVQCLPVKSQSLPTQDYVFDGNHKSRLLPVLQLCFSKLILYNFQAVKLST